MPSPSHRLTKLIISQSGVGDTGLGAIGALTGLRELDLSNNWAMTDDGMAALSGLRDLQWLNLTGSNQARFVVTQHLLFCRQPSCHAGSFSSLLCCWGREYNRV